MARGARCIAMVTEIVGADDIEEKISKVKSNFREGFYKMYTTQMDAAKKGIITDEMRIVAEKEGVHVEKLRELVASGKVVIPANKNHKKLEPQGIGEGLRTKINVNIGISKDCCNFEMELEKAKKAIELKAEAIMDLSSYGKTREFRRKLVEMSPVMIGTVPVYDAVGFYEKDLKDISAEEFFEVVEKHAEDGVGLYDNSCRHKPGDRKEI